MVVFDSIRHEWKGEELLDRIRKNVQRSLAASAVILHTEIKNQLNKGSSPPPSAPGSPPHKLTGALGQSIQVDLRGVREKTPRARVGPNLFRVPYARIQELGGTIVPKKGKYLAVPLGEEGRKASQSAGAAGLRSLNLVFIPRRGKLPLLARKIGKRIKPLFVLVRSVTLPARPYLKPSAQLARPAIRKQFTSKKLLAGV